MAALKRDAPMKPAPAPTGRKIRGRPIESLTHAQLVRELDKALSSVENLEDTVRWHNGRWRDKLRAERA